MEYNPAMKNIRKPVFFLFFFLSIFWFFVYSNLFAAWSTGTQSSIFRFREGLPEVLPFSQLDVAINYSMVYNRVLFGEYLFDEPLSSSTLNQIHPRSTTIIFNQISPVGFPGIIVLMSVVLLPLMWLFGSYSVNLFLVGIIPLIAVLTPVVLYRVLVPIFQKRIALISAVLLYCMPLWWYYAAWPVQHHSLLIFCIVLFLYLAQRSIGNHITWNHIAAAWGSGIAFALAIYLRPVELLWLIPLVVVLYIHKRNKLSVVYHLYPFAIGAGMIAVLFFYTQMLFYGHPLATGYVIPQTTGVGGTVFGTDQPEGLLVRVLLPYGFNIMNLLYNAYHYLFVFVWPWTVLSFLGLGVIYRNRQRRSFQGQKQYAWYVLAVSLWLLFYYGSSAFIDNLSGQVATIGTSYTRYFLPIYVAALPLAVRGGISLILSLRSGYRIWGAIALAGLLIGHGYQVVYRGNDGIHALEQRLAQFYEERTQVLAHTQPTAIIVTKTADKYIFPYRRVMVTAEDEPERFFPALMSVEEQGYPLFWYYHVPTDETAMIGSWNERLAPYQFRLSEPVWQGYSMQLRRIEKIELIP